MNNIKLLTANELAKLTNHRSGEIKFGEKVEIVPDDVDIWKFIKESSAKFVLFGIPEDIGVKANHGRTGAATAFESALKSLLNIQHNKFCKGNDLLILGALDVAQEMEKASHFSISNKNEKKELFDLVSKVDKVIYMMERTTTEFMDMLHE